MNDMAQLHYHVDYELNGQVHTQKDIWASNPGVAIAECQKMFPKAKMIKAWIDGSWKDGYGYTEFLAPPVQRDPVKEPKPYHAPKRNDREGVMPFYDEVLIEAEPAHSKAANKNQPHPSR
jgi:hypothetical protein